MTESVRHLPELLAPAGNPACALAAFDAGADAVYCGLKKFNARERTENFSAEELDKIIGWAGTHGKKVFVTLNTLIKEDELPELGDTLAELDRLRPDAVIVQDAGVLHAIRNFFPGLTVHASTQMGFHNSAGLSLAAELGIRRVILERQTTLDELERMMRNKPPGIETELFIHGALCCCISGSCLLSSWLGGWSGNRGKCKQPCRRRYHSGEGNGFFLSAQDLCTLDLLPRILRTGVASLKIEGRLRRPDYVSRTVEAYRLALDAAAESPEAFSEILPKAREILAHTCGRKWSGGFYTKESAQGLIKHDAIGASGLLCGKVLSVENGGFTVAAMRRIHIGDLIRIQPRTGDEGPAVPVLRMTRNGEPVHAVRKNEICFIASDREIPADAFVYKIGESCPDYSRRIAALPPSKPVLSLEAEVSRHAIVIRTSAGPVWEKELVLEEAGRHPLSAAAVEEAFSNRTWPGFRIGRIRAVIHGSPFLPASVLKSLCLAFRDWMEQRFDPEAAARKTEERRQRFRAALNGISRRERLPAKTSVILPKGLRPPRPDVSVVREADAFPGPGEELLLPFFIPETELDSVRETVRAYAGRGGRTVRITSLHHLFLLREFPDLTIRTCMPLPVCNSMAVLELRDLGVHDVQLWIELGKQELETLAAHSVLPVEIYRYGRPVLLTTRASIPAKGTLTDARGNAFRIGRDGGFTRLTAEKVFSIPAVSGAEFSLADLRNAAPEETGTALFNFQCGLR